MSDIVIPDENPTTQIQLSEPEQDSEPSTRTWLAHVERAQQRLVQEREAGTLPNTSLNN